MLAPAPSDIIWQNANIKPAERANSKLWGAFLLTVVCFLNTVPLVIVAALSNLVSLSAYVPFLRSWQSAGNFGNWTFSTVSGVLPPVVSAIFQLLLPYFIRKITKYQGLVRIDRSQLPDEAALTVRSQYSPPGLALAGRPDRLYPLLGLPRLLSVLHLLAARRLRPARRQHRGRSRPGQERAQDPGRSRRPAADDPTDLRPAKRLLAHRHADARLPCLL